jgi:translation initiation factor IF-3
MVKQFRGSSYLQESLDYKTSIDQAQRLLQQGYTVTLMVTFQAQKNIDPTLANQLLNQVVQTFPNWVEVEQTSALQDRQMMIQLSPHKQEASI